EQLENWVAEFDFWEICDQCLMSLIVKTPFAKTKAVEWARREQEYVRRAGYALMALLALKRMKTTNEELLNFLPVIKEGLGDDRRTVKLAISWALRQIGKRNLTLNAAIQREMKSYKTINTKTAQWVITDVLKDITREAVLKKLQAREPKKES
ncbi:MAG: DNA alkylation repair protein, partial [Candidatus Heimdallarchaeota archaeon]